MILLKNIDISMKNKGDEWAKRRVEGTILAIYRNLSVKKARMAYSGFFKRLIPITPYLNVIGLSVVSGEGKNGNEKPESRASDSVKAQGAPGSRIMRALAKPITCP